ncbi:MAG: hypothetical protein IT373_27420 [Polyangiaceae bacterium]|nr:hypothetical protein [Polyangiaceae bacterium]
MASPKRSISKPRARGLVMKQFPIDFRAGYITELTFMTGTNVNAKVIATNVTTVGAYASNKEYWYTAGNTSGSSVALTTSTSTYTEAQLDTFRGRLPAAFTWTQNIGTGGWTQGTYTPTTGRTNKLYKAPDPDQSGVYIGMLTEQETSTNKLLRTVWYKTSNTGTIWATNPASLTFTQVLDQAGAPSTDPNDIQATTWYYAVSP